MLALAGGAVPAVEPPPPPVLLVAGDIAGCDSTAHEATAAILDAQPGTIAAVGDLAYENGTAQQFADCYGPSWGRHRDRTFPVPGNHEYMSQGATPYYDYFGARVGPPDRGYYSYDLGDWHLVALNSNCSDVPGGCGVGSPQETWLRTDLAASAARCTLAYWHHASFTSGTNHGPSTRMNALLQALQADAAELVLQGHEHNYERFAPQLPNGTASANGIRAFVVGTGGRGGSYPLSVPPAPNSEVRAEAVRGVLKLTLRPDGYDWQFLPVAGLTFTDSGSGSCHDGPQPDSTRPTAPTNLTATAVSGGRVDLAWTASGDNVGVAGYRIVRDGTQIATSGTTAYSDATVSPARSYDYQVIAYDAALNVSPPSNLATAVTPAADRLLTFGPSDDAYVTPDTPSTNFGAAKTVDVDASPVKAALLKFVVQGVGGGTVTSAKLRLHNTNPSNRGGDVSLAANSSWSEQTVSWSNAPAAGTFVGSFGTVSLGGNYELAVPVAGDGTVAFRINSPSSDGAAYDTKEAGNGLGPKLILTVADPANPDNNPPTAPTNLTATAVSNGRVDLTWTASGDDNRVAGYRIRRGGVEIATSGTTSYSDLTVAPATRYDYQVVAYDPALNDSPLSNTATAFTPAGERTLTFAPSADAHLEAAKPTTNFGGGSTLQADKSPVKAFLIKFTVSGVGAGTVRTARLRLHVTNDSNSGGDFRTASGNWTETSVSWANAPAGGSVVGSLGRVAIGGWYELPLAVAGDGVLSLRVDSTSDDGVAYDSRERGAAFAPQLVLTVADP